MIEIIKKHKDYVVIYKPPGIPTQPDPTGDSDAMTLTASALSACGEQSKLWLVHRLDRVVGGILVFARTQRAAAQLSESASGDDMRKEYLAVAEGAPEGGTYIDVLFKDARVGKAFIVDRERHGAKMAELNCEPIAAVNERTLVRVRLSTGRFHQIRVQLASRGTPLVGDGKYGSRDKDARMPSLFAYRLSFTYCGERVECMRLPDTSVYPWSLFNNDEYEKVQK